AGGWRDRTSAASSTTSPARWRSAAGSPGYPPSRARAATTRNAAASTSPTRKSSRWVDFPPKSRCSRSLLLRGILRLQRTVVLAHEGANVVGHVEQSNPLLLVQRHRKPAEAVHRQAALLADLHRHAPAGTLLEPLVLGPQALQLLFHVLVHHG